MLRLSVLILAVLVLVSAFDMQERSYGFDDDKQTVKEKAEWKARYRTSLADQVCVACSRAFLGSSFVPRCAGAKLAVGGARKCKQLNRLRAVADARAVEMQGKPINLTYKKLKSLVRDGIPADKRPRVCPVLVPHDLIGMRVADMAQSCQSRLAAAIKRGRLW